MSNAAADYSVAVVNALAAEFPTLTDPVVASVVGAVVERHSRRPDPAFEVIVDDPVAANWRLRPHHEAPGRVRLACYRVPPTQADLDREQRVNHTLDLRFAV